MAREVEISKQVRLGGTQQHHLFYSHPKDTLLKSQFVKTFIAFLSRALGAQRAV